MKITFQFEETDRKLIDKDRNLIDKDVNKRFQN